MTVDLLDTVRLFLESSKGFESNKEPLQIQFLTSGMARGCRFTQPFCIGFEIGFGRAMAGLLIVETLMGCEKEVIVALTSVLQSLKFMICTYRAAPDFETLISRRIGELTPF